MSIFNTVKKTPSHFPESNKSIEIKTKTNSKLKKIAILGLVFTLLVGGINFTTNNNVIVKANGFTPSCGNNAIQTSPTFNNNGQSKLVGTNLYVADDSKISVIDTTNNTVITTIPTGMAAQKMIGYNGKLYVFMNGAQYSDRLTVIDTATNTITVNAMVVAGSYTQELVGSKIYIANFSNTISIFDTATNTISSTISFPGNPQIFGNIGGNLYIKASSSYYFYVLDTATNILGAGIYHPWSPQTASVVGSKMYLANSDYASITVVDLTTNTWIQSIPVNNTQRSSVNIGNTVYVLHGFNTDEMTVINGLTGSVLGHSILTASGSNYMQNLRYFNGKLMTNDFFRKQVHFIDPVGYQLTNSVAIPYYPQNGTAVDNKLYISSGNNVYILDTDAERLILPCATFGSANTITGIKNYPFPNIPLNGNTVADNTIATFTPSGSSTIIQGKIINNRFVPNPNQNIPADVVIGNSNGVLKSNGISDLTIPTDFVIGTLGDEPVTIGGMVGDYFPFFNLPGANLPDSLFNPPGTEIKITFTGTDKFLLGKLQGSYFSSVKYFYPSGRIPLDATIGPSSATLSVPSDPLIAPKIITTNFTDSSVSQNINAQIKLSILRETDQNTYFYDQNHDAIVNFQVTFDRPIDPNSFSTSDIAIQSWQNISNTYVNNRCVPVKLTSNPEYPTRVFDFVLNCGKNGPAFDILITIPQGTISNGSVINDLIEYNNGYHVVVDSNQNEFLDSPDLIDPNYITVDIPFINQSNINNFTITGKCNNTYYEHKIYIDVTGERGNVTCDATNNYSYTPTIPLPNSSLNCTITPNNDCKYYATMYSDPGQIVYGATNYSFVQTLGSYTGSPITGIKGSPFPTIFLNGGNLPDNTVSTLSLSSSTTVIQGTIAGGNFIPNPNQTIPNDIVLGNSNGILSSNNVPDLIIATNFSTPNIGTTYNPIQGYLDETFPNVQLRDSTIASGTSATLTLNGSATTIYGTILSGNGTQFYPNNGSKIPLDAFVGNSTAIMRVAGAADSVIPTIFQVFGGTFGDQIGVIEGNTRDEFPIIEFARGGNFPFGWPATFTPTGSSTAINGYLNFNYFVPSAGSLIPDDVVIGPSTGTISATNLPDQTLQTNFTANISVSIGLDFDLYFDDTKYYYDDEHDAIANFTVSFNKSIDPSTFTASDIVLTGAATGCAIGEIIPKLPNTTKDFRVIINCGRDSSNHSKEVNFYIPSGVVSDGNYFNSGSTTRIFGVPVLFYGPEYSGPDYFPENVFPYNGYHTVDIPTINQSNLTNNLTISGSCKQYYGDVSIYIYRTGENGSAPCDNTGRYSFVTTVPLSTSYLNCIPSVLDNCRYYVTAYNDPGDNPSAATGYSTPQILGSADSISGATGSPFPNIILTGNNLPDNTPATFTQNGSSSTIQGLIINNSFVPVEGSVIPNDVTIGSSIGVLSSNEVADAAVVTNFSSPFTQPTILVPPLVNQANLTSYTISGRCNVGFDVGVIIQLSLSSETINTPCNSNGTYSTASPIVSNGCYWNSLSSCQYTAVTFQNINNIDYRSESVVGTVDIGTYGEILISGVVNIANTSNVIFDNQTPIRYYCTDNQTFNFSSNLNNQIATLACNTLNNNIDIRSYFPTILPNGLLTISGTVLDENGNTNSFSYSKQVCYDPNFTPTETGRGQFYSDTQPNCSSVVQSSSSSQSSIISNSSSNVSSVIQSSSQNSSISSSTSSSSCVVVIPFLPDCLNSSSSSATQSSSYSSSQTSDQISSSSQTSSSSIQLASSSQVTSSSTSSSSISSQNSSNPATQIASSSLSTQSSISTQSLATSSIARTITVPNPVINSVVKINFEPVVTSSSSLITINSSSSISNSSSIASNISSSISSQSQSNSSNANISSASSASTVADCETLTDVFITKDTDNLLLDKEYSYPAGFVNFSARCASAMKVKIYWFGVDTNTNYVNRKYNALTKTYSDVTDIVTAVERVNGVDVLTYTYIVNDNGTLDEDPTIGFIKDPIGPGILVQSNGALTITNTPKIASNSSSVSSLDNSSSNIINAGQNIPTKLEENNNVESVTQNNMINMTVRTGGSLPNNSFIIIIFILLSFGEITNLIYQKRKKD
jgi:YVTN family beta-propeller protein